jgi:hypothetical protein
MGYEKMQAVSIVLFLISVGTILGPVGAVVITNTNDLTQLVIPPEIKDQFMGGNGPLGGGGDYNNGGNGDNGDNGGNGTAATLSLGLLNVQLVQYTIDQTTNTFSITLSVTNNIGYDLTLNSLSATAVNYQTNAALASISLSNPAAIPKDSTSTVTVAGTWTPAGEALVTSGATTVDLSLSNISIDVNGIIAQPNEPEHIGVISLT